MRDSTTGWAVIGFRYRCRDKIDKAKEVDSDVHTWTTEVIKPRVKKHQP